MKLKSLDFREKRKQAWQELEELLSRMEKHGPQALSPEETMRLAKLYRTACSSLYLTRHISLDRNLNQYLENLVAQGFIGVYCSKPSENLLKNFVLREFPQTVQCYWPYHLVSLLVLLFGFIVGFGVTRVDPSYYHTFVDRQLAQERTPYSSRQQLARSLESGRESSSGELTLFASFLFTHNSKVGLLSLTSGVLTLPPVYLMFINGSTLGAMSEVFHHNQLAGEWWAWILPHGITEFLAIVLCAGAGLMMGVAVLLPGKHGRLYQLKQVGRKAGVIFMGTIGLFFIAGAIEGYFRQGDFGLLPRYALAGFSVVFWVYYFGFFPKHFRPRGMTSQIGESE